MVVVDTSILIDHLRADERARDLLQRGTDARQRLLGSVLTKVEVLGGVRAPEKSATYRLLSLLEWIPVDEALADRAGRMARQYHGSHPGVDPVDYVIAATAESMGAELWTRNRKHFPMLPDLVDPYSGR